VHRNDHVDKFIPMFAPPIMRPSRDATQIVLQRPEHPVTLSLLLSHQSGIPFRSSLETPTLDSFPLALRVQSYALTPLDFEPGSNFAYSNAGINVAARVIELVSGMKFEEFLQRRLFEPLGMKDTTFWPSEESLSRLAKPYKPNAAGTDLEETTISQLRYPLSDHASRYPLPAGGLFSTASDLGKFCQMLLSGGTVGGRRYLSQDAIREMTRNQLRPTEEAPPKGGYALGWYTRSTGAYWHGGAYATNMTIDLARGLITIWLVQHAGFAGDGAKSQAEFERAAIDSFGQ